MGKAPGVVLGQETAILGAVTQTERRGLGKQDTSGRGDAEIQMFGAAFFGGKTTSFGSPNDSGGSPRNHGGEERGEMKMAFVVNRILGFLVKKMKFWLPGTQSSHGGV